jgi:hypothetical protein
MCSLLWTFRVFEAGHEMTQEGSFVGQGHSLDAVAGKSQ